MSRGTGTRQSADSEIKDWGSYKFLFFYCSDKLIIFLRKQNGDLMLEARKGKLYRDEVDAMREKADRADKLEGEVQRYRERLADAEFYKVRVDELREDNRVLLETREMLETQLTRARKRSERVLELEAELLSSKQIINDIALVSLLKRFSFFFLIWDF